MYSLELPSGEILDMPIDVQFSFELNNSIFTSGDTSVLPGSFSFPVKLPENGKNTALFNHPQLPTAANPVRTIEGVWVRASNVRIFYGTLKLRRAGGGLEVSIVAQPLTSIKTTKLSELDLGGDISFGADDATRNTHMQNTVNSPDSYNYIFAEIFAPVFISSFMPGIDTDQQLWQNKYDPASADFFLELGPVTPFPKVSFVLEKLIELSSWHFSNDWQIVTELQRLYYHSHVDIHDATGTTRFLPDTFNLSDHVPDINGNTALKQLAEMFCLGVFTNVFTRQISIKPLETVLNAAPAKDWTSYVDGGAVAEYEDSTAPDILRHKPLDYTIRGGGGATFSPKPFFGEVEDLEAFQTMEEFYAANTAGTTDGFYYIQTVELIVYVQRTPAPLRWFIVRHAREAIRNGADTSLELSLQPLRTSQLSESGAYFYGAEFRGNGSYYYTGDTANDLAWNSNTNDPAIFFYRGFKNRANYNPTGNVPYSTPADWLPDGSKDTGVNYSLLWTGDNGLYNRFWKTWYTMLSAGKPISYQLLLPIHELVSFNFDQKIRILNMDYFAVSLTINRLTADGKFLVEANLFSII